MPEALNKPYKRSKTTDLMKILNDVLYLCGMRNFWVGEVRGGFSRRFTRVYDVVSRAIDIGIFFLTILLLSSFITKENLSKKQQAEIVVVNLSVSSSFYNCIIFRYNKQKIRDILHKLLIILKAEYNDAVVEKEMITSLLLYVGVYFLSGYCTIIFCGAYAAYQKIHAGTPFITLITAWPEVDDESNVAECGRVIFYFSWFISFPRVSSCYILLLLMLINLSKQYKNLQCYFYGLDQIFAENLSQREKEKKYVKGFIKGVQMHSETMWCLNKSVRVCQRIFDTQITLAFMIFFALLPMLMNSSHDPGSLLVHVPTIIISLVLLGFFMWNAGDISVESSKLPSAIYGSGWQNCHYRTKQIRKLVTIAVAQAQQPVTLKALGFMELSYDSYLSVLKTAYSFFSVLY